MKLVKPPLVVLHRPPELDFERRHVDNDIEALGRRAHVDVFGRFDPLGLVLDDQMLLVRGNARLGDRLVEAGFMQENSNPAVPNMVTASLAKHLGIDNPTPSIL